MGTIEPGERRRAVDTTTSGVEAFMTSMQAELSWFWLFSPISAEKSHVEGVPHCKRLMQKVQSVR